MNIAVQRLIHDLNVLVQADILDSSSKKRRRTAKADDSSPNKSAVAGERVEKVRSSAFRGVTKHRRSGRSVSANVLIPTESCALLSCISKLQCHTALFPSVIAAAV